MIYLDNAATGRYKPQSVYEEMMKQLQNAANPGRSGHFPSLRAAEALEGVREKIKKRFNAENAQVIFTCNCTEALNYAILGWLRKFKNVPSKVICTAYDHNSVLRPLNALKGEQELETQVIFPQKSGEIDVRQLAAALTPQTRLAVVTHISNVTGAVTDIKAAGEVCARAGVPLLVDCAQSAGHLFVDMQAAGAAFLCVPGHKGLHGPQGSGFLLIAEGYELLPVKFGGTGTDSLSMSQPDYLPEALESGTLNVPAVCGLGAGMEWTFANMLQINARIKTFCAILRERLSRLPRIRLYSAPESGLVTFAAEGISSVDMADELNERGIAVRGGLHCAPLAHAALGTSEQGLVRISPGWQNTPAQAEVAAAEIERAMARLTSRGERI